MRKTVPNSGSKHGLPVAVDSIHISSIDSSLQTSIDTYTQSEFGQVPIVQKYKWATPSWSVVVRIGEELVSFLNIIERDIRVDEAMIRAAGINNVITPPQFRGRGYSTLAMQCASKFMFERLPSAMGLLLCSNELVSYYEKHGWQAAKCPVVFDQPDGKVTWTQNAMVLVSDGSPFHAARIDLCGYPW